MKKALTYTLIAGNRTCPNDCGICISKMTPDQGMGSQKPYVDWGRFDQATQIALNHQAENVLITSKGESTYHPGQISQYLYHLSGKPFDRRELQTEGSLIANGRVGQFLDLWKDMGLMTIAVSMYHYDDAKNKEMFRPRNGQHYELPKLIEKINSAGFNTRLSCCMLDSYIDSVEEVDKLVDFAKKNGVFQLTLRRADRPDKPLDEKVAEFVDKHRVGDERIKEIRDYIDSEGRLVDVLPHGAEVFELNGQNVCITTGLSHNPGDEEVRQLIFFPPGWLTTSWESVQGGRLL